MIGCWTVAPLRGGPHVRKIFTPTTDFVDTSTPTNQTNYWSTDGYARVAFTTFATQVTLGIWTNLTAAGEAIGVLVNDVYYVTVNCTVNPGLTTVTVALPAGSKKVTLVNNGQGLVGGVVYGAWLVSADFNDRTTQVTLSTANSLTMIGDSILNGSDASPIHRDGVIPYLRSYWPGAVRSMAIAAAALADVGGTGTARTALVTSILANSPTTVYIEHCRNDYGAWSAASFGTAYADLLDKLHAASSSLVIYCQSSIVQAVETANGFGNTLQDYRDQISSAVSSRTGYAHYINGATMLTLTDLQQAPAADAGVHPSPAGALKYSQAVKTALGL